MQINARVQFEPARGGETLARFRRPSAGQYEPAPQWSVVKKVITAGTSRFGTSKPLYLANAMFDAHIGLEETPTASRLSTSIKVCWRHSTNAITSSPADRVLPIMPD